MLLFDWFGNVFIACLRCCYCYLGIAGLLLIAVLVDFRMLFDCYIVLFCCLVVYWCCRCLVDLIWCYLSVWPGWLLCNLLFVALGWFEWVIVLLYSDRLVMLVFDYFVVFYWYCLLGSIDRFVFAW